MSKNYVKVRKEIVQEKALRYEKLSTFDTRTKPVWMEQSEER